MLQIKSASPSIKATINKSSIKDQQTLYISKKQLPLVVDLVKDHMHPSMLYKFKGPQFKVKKKYTTINQLILSMWQTRETSRIGN